MPFRQFEFLTGIGDVKSSPGLATSLFYPDQVESQPRRQNASPLFERIRTHEKSAYAECIAAYSGFVMQVAEAYTPNQEEAGIATAEIFNEIWAYASDSKLAELDDHGAISYIAHQYFLHRSYSS